jgi:HlyD family secretion protein
MLVGALGGWAATSQIAGAVLAQGTVVVESNVRKVQHPTGGIVGELRVREGDDVRQGDLLMRLDDTITRANLQVIVKQLDELGMRQARLQAERDGANVLNVPASLTARAHDPAVAEIISGETSLFKSRRAGRESQRSQLGERIAQLRQEIAGLTAQLAAKREEIGLVKAELESLAGLSSRGLVATSRVTPLRRDVARFEGEQGQINASMAQLQGRIAETELQLIQIDQDLRTEIVRDLRDAQSKEAELIERRITAEDQLRRVEVRAPDNGIIHQLSVHTVGGVINPSEPVALIVPAGDQLVIEARVAQQDIEQLYLGQQAWLRMTAFNQRTTPEIQGTVQRISPDLVREPQTGASYFVVRLASPSSEVEKLGGRLLPGMPVDVQIKTQERTALSYFLRPMKDQMARAFRER